MTDQNQIITRHQELADGGLYFPGYSTEVSAWTRLAVHREAIISSLNQRPITASFVHQKLLQEWHLHHLWFYDNGLLAPPPPTLSQVYSAFIWAEKKGILNCQKPVRVFFNLLPWRK